MVLSPLQSTVPMLKTIMKNKVFKWAVVIDLASSSTAQIYLSTIFAYFKYIKHVENTSRAQVLHMKQSLGRRMHFLTPMLTVC